MGTPEYREIMLKHMGYKNVTRDIEGDSGVLVVAK